jgi:hypothetical protein
MDDGWYVSPLAEDVDDIEWICFNSFVRVRYKSYDEKCQIYSIDSEMNCPVGFYIPIINDNPQQ